MGGRIAPSNCFSDLTETQSDSYLPSISRSSVHTERSTYIATNFKIIQQRKMIVSRRIFLWRLPIISSAEKILTKVGRANYLTTTRSRAGVGGVMSLFHDL